MIIKYLIVDDGLGLGQVQGELSAGDQVERDNPAVVSSAGLFGQADNPGGKLRCLPKRDISRRIAGFTY